LLISDFVDAAKQRGVRLGSYGAETLAPKYRAEAKVRAKQLAPVIREMQRCGYSIRGMAVPRSVARQWVLPFQEISRNVENEHGVSNLLKRQQQLSATLSRLQGLLA
jgi:hypothetical protein